MSKTWTRSLCIIAAWTMAVFSTISFAQGSSNRSLTLIVPYPAGTSTDIMARIVAASLSERLKRPIVVDNKAGAGALVGVNALKQSPKDGNTFGVIVSGNVVQPWVQKDVPFDIKKDFIPLTLMYTGQYLLNVGMDFPAANLAEFLAYGKANPGKISFGSAGSGTSTHLAIEMFKQLTSINAIHVPFKGSPQIVASVISGDVHAYFDLYGTSKAYLDSKRVRALGVSGSQRMAGLPQVPAIAELVPGYEAVAWGGFAMPVGVPPAIASNLGENLRAVINSPDISKRIRDLGVDPSGNSQAEFTRFISDEFDKWGRIVKAAGLKPE